MIFKLLKSLLKARKIIKAFKPQIAVGVGGYASGPTLQMANMLNIPTLIQEQNSYAGVTNKLLAKKAAAICVAYDNMDRFFPKEKIRLTGNPCRQDLAACDVTKEEAITFFNLAPNKKTILIIGGSLGAKMMNQSVVHHYEKIAKSDIQIIWQCGEYYLHELVAIQAQKGNTSNIRLYDFISRMDLAYKASDLVISRAGAGSISELSLLKKPTILVPSPNVAEDHQTKNAMALVEKDAAILIKDKDAVKGLIPIALETIHNEEILSSLSQNIAKLAEPNSAERIVDEVVKIITREKQ